MTRVLETQRITNDLLNKLFINNSLVIHRSLQNLRFLHLLLVFGRFQTQENLKSKSTLSLILFVSLVNTDYQYFY